MWLALVDRGLAADTGAAVPPVEHDLNEHADLDGSPMRKSGGEDPFQRFIAFAGEHADENKSSVPNLMVFELYLPMALRRVG